MKWIGLGRNWVWPICTYYQPVSVEENHEVLTSLTLQMLSFWIVTPCGTSGQIRTFCLHLRSWSEPLAHCEQSVTLAAPRAQFVSISTPWTLWKTLRLQSVCCVHLHLVITVHNVAYFSTYASACVVDCSSCVDSAFLTMPYFFLCSRVDDLIIRTDLESSFQHFLSLLLPIFHVGLQFHHVIGHLFSSIVLSRLSAQHYCCVFGTSIVKVSYPGSSILSEFFFPSFPACKFMMVPQSRPWLPHPM